MDAEEIKVLKYMGRIITNNENLQHLDLTNTSLGEEIILALCERAKKSKTLQSVHFCGNPGVTPAIKQKVLKIFNQQPADPTKGKQNAGTKEDENNQKPSGGNFTQYDAYEGGKPPVTFMPKPNAAK